MQLVIVDTVHIQPYIFGSNRLRENIGGSHIIAESTGAWALEAVCHTARQKSNVEISGNLNREKRIEDPTADLDAEVLYAGGGNFVVLFRDEKGAKNFTRTLSRKVLTEAPNLQLVIVQEPFTWTESLYDKVKTTFQKKLAEEKHARSLSAPLLGLGVTAVCRSTGLPAVGVTQPIESDPGYPASAEIHAKIAVARATGPQPSPADARLHGVIPHPAGYDYPSGFDDLGGTKGEHNYIAVVHADGNGIGRRIMDFGRAYSTAGQNRDYINVLRRFSNTIQDAAQAALKEALKPLVERLKQDGGNCIVHRNSFGKPLVEIKLRRATDGTPYLPLRPIVFGGDDLTFVCDGRLGLSLAIQYLQQFERCTANLPDGKGKATSCAGIAIVKTHYPFAQAYALADELCKSAKDYRRREGLDNSCLDWHFALSGLSGDIEEIRKREYKVKAGCLTLRPMALRQNPKESHRTWDVVLKGIRAFQDLLPDTVEPVWSTRRNKVKALRDALREGPESVGYFLTKFNKGKPLPQVEPSMTDWPTKGWQGKCCGYFDAIELSDWFIPLEEDMDNAAGAPSGTQE